MANPQKEDGWIAIPNEVVDALCRCHPGGSEGQVLWAIIRKTDGWHKQTDKISFSQLCEMTGLARRTVIYALQNLEAKNMITIKRQDCGANNIAFNKNCAKWIVQEMDGSARKSTSYRATIEKQKANYKNREGVQEIAGGARNYTSDLVSIENQEDNCKTNEGGARNRQTGVQEIAGGARNYTSDHVSIENQEDNCKTNEGGARNYRGCKKSSKGVQEIVNKLPFLAPTKETITKDNTKDISFYNNYVANSESLRLAELLYSEIITQNSKSRLAAQNTTAREKTITDWARDIEKLIGIDQQEPSTVEEVIFFATHDDFWGPNILSGKKLREKWDTLTRKMNQKGQKHGNAKPSGIEPFSDIPVSMRGGIWD